MNDLSPDAETSKADVLNSYQYLWVSDDDDYKNRAYQEADASNVPLAWVEQRRKYAKFHSDFVTADGYELSESAYEDLHEINRRWVGLIVLDYKDSVGVDCATGTRVNWFNNLKHEHIWQYVDEVCRIIYDECCWEPISLK